MLEHYLFVDGLPGQMSDAVKGSLFIGPFQKSWESRFDMKALQVEAGDACHRFDLPIQASNQKIVTQSWVVGEHSSN